MKSLLLLSLCTLLVYVEGFMVQSVIQNERSSTTSLFEQPQRRFAQAASKKKYGADSKLASKHEERIRTAGRVGTKRFVDPCKVFIGNLPFNTDADEMSRFVLDTMGQSRLVLHSSKVVYDWKTGKSKGFGFMVFADPIYATVCMEVVSGKSLNGRNLTVSQGKKKDDDSQLYLEKKRKKAETTEDEVIASALEAADSDDPDGIPVFGNNDQDDIELDAVLFGIAADDEDDDDYDGIFLERKPIYDDMDPNMNRAQRRDAGRRLKKQKLPHKGFG